MSLLLFLCREKPCLSVTHPTWGKVQRTENLTGIFPYVRLCGLSICLWRDARKYLTPRMNPPHSMLWPIKLPLETQHWAKARFQDQWRIIRLPLISDDTFVHLDVVCKGDMVKKMPVWPLHGRVKEKGFYCRHDNEDN